MPVSIVPEWNIYRTRFLIKAKQLTEPLAFVDTFGREQRGQPGDYLVESSEGRRSIQRREIFEDVYVAMGPAEECASAGLQPDAALAGFKQSLGSPVAIA
jgi:hypothetical protein